MELDGRSGADTLETGHLYHVLGQQNDLMEYEKDRKGVSTI